MKMYKSKVWWPKDSGLDFGNLDFTTEDVHITEKEANSVCNILNEKGFGSMEKIFPLKTEVSLNGKIIG